MISNKFIILCYVFSIFPLFFNLKIFFIFFFLISLLIILIIFINDNKNSNKNLINIFEIIKISKLIINKSKNSDSVFIMGHKFSDFDSIGASVGIFSLISKYNKKINIIINKENSMGLSLINYIEKNISFNNIIITAEEAFLKVTNNSFLIIVDTSSDMCFENKELYNKFKSIAVIDHHEISVNKIKNVEIYFHNPNTSSTCEMVTELLKYNKKNNLKKWEAECLLSGIILDTNNFSSIKCSYRTFELSAYLKKIGSDSIIINKIFSDSIDNHKIKCKIIQNAYIVNKFAISKYEDNINSSRSPCVKAANELLNIKNIEASFIIFKNNDGISISARSLGDINVQRIMKLLGGGGHQNMAAVHIKNITLEEAESKLNEIIKTKF